MADPAVVQVMNEWRADLLSREAQQFQEMARRWMQVENSLEGQIALLIQQVEDEGGLMTAGQLARLTRYQQLLVQLQEETRKYAAAEEPRIAAQQQAYGEAGIDSAVQAIDAVGGPEIRGTFNILPVRAIENMVGLAGDGSPLRKLLEEAWPDGALAMTNVLVKNTALGINPRQTAREMMKASGATLQRALVIARTESLRVYREASRQQYQASGLVTGYRRLCAKQTRTCFPAGTLVLTERGAVPIEAIREGDRVWTGKRRLRRVTAPLSRFYDGGMVRFMTESGALLTATDEHPILTERNGQLHWVAAGSLAIGNRVVCGLQCAAQDLDHLRRDRTIERRVWQAHDQEPASGKAQGLAAVGVGALVPIDAIDLEGDVQVGQMEVNRVAIERGLLDESDLQGSQTLTGLGFRLGFSSVPSVASWVAELLIGHAGNDAERLGTLATGVDDRRSAAQLRAMRKPFSAAERLAAPPADSIAADLADAPVCRDARRTALDEFRSTWIENEPSTTSHTGSHDTAGPIGFIAGLAAEPARGAEMGDESLSALLASGFGSFSLQQSSALATAAQLGRIPAGVLDVGGRLVKSFAADRAGDGDSFVGPGASRLPFAYGTAVRSKGSLDRRRVPQHSGSAGPATDFDHDVSPFVFDMDTVSFIEKQINAETTVFNLEVEEDHTYFAAGLLVHNCAACLLDDGHFYKLDEVMPAHPQCRCAMVPAVEGMPPIAFQTGQEWFLLQDEATQRDILGPKRFDAWKDGTIKLLDIPSARPDATWGPSMQPRTLAQILREGGNKAWPMGPAAVAQEPTPVADRSLLTGINTRELPQLPGTFWEVPPEIEAHSRLLADALTREQKQAFKQYSSIEYGRLNAALRGVVPLTEDSAELAELLSDAISTHGRLKMPVTVFRGMHFDDEPARDEFVKKLARGAIFENEGFWSTSFDANFGAHFAYTDKIGIIFEVKAQTGVFMDSSLSNHDEELELLINHKSKFQILDAYYGQTGYEKFLVVQVEQLK